jgi:hypothetical protein
MACMNFSTSVSVCTQYTMSSLLPYCDDVQLLCENACSLVHYFCYIHFQMRHVISYSIHRNAGLKFEDCARNNSLQYVVNNEIESLEFPAMFDSITPRSILW